MIVVSIIALLLVVAMPSYFRARARSAQTNCQSNLSVIFGAKERWALENQQGGGAPVEMSDLVGPFAYIRIEPTCPAGGDYTVGAIGVDPSCTMSSDPEFPHVLAIGAAGS